MTGDERVILSVCIGEYERTVKDSVKDAETQLRARPRDKDIAENLADARKDLQTVQNLRAIFGM